MNYYIRDIQLKDLQAYKKLIQPDNLYHQLNGPYYRIMQKNEIDTFISEIGQRILDNKTPIDTKKMIVERNTENLIGQVNWYWKSKETNWLEIGIVLFNEHYWGKGIGSTILPMWIDEMFIHFPDIIRIGLSTWSGNIRMIKLAKKIGLKKEAHYIKARIVNAQYYDSLSFGILKDEWVKHHTTSLGLRG